MRIRSFAHKGLTRMQEADELRALSVWKVHTLTGDRKGTSSLSLTRSRRLTFTIDDEREICDLNSEDYRQQREYRTMPMKDPPHPGDFIRTEIIEPAGLSVTAAAAALQVSRPALSSLLNSRADLSGEMALRIEKAFGVKMETLMRMQSAFDIARTRSREKEIRVRRFHPPAEARL